MDLFEFASQKAKEDEDQPKDEKGLQEPIFSVGDLTAEVKALIKNRFGREGFWVKGEVSNFRGRNQSGHMYFSLKDSRAVLNCVYFRNANQKNKVELKDGLEVLAFGRLDVWEPSGRYQLIVETVRPGGLGELYLRFEQLKKKLEAEGLFAEDRKKPIPEYPQRIGVVTSPTGAVIRDIIHVAHRRCPSSSILLVPVKVQGEGAAQEIAAAISELNRSEHNVDVIIVGRGGGSIEDLWAFNEEIVARSIAESVKPVISAVGHQTDFTIADFVSDKRAATPSQAAELAVPDISELKRRADVLIRNIVRELVQHRNLAHEKVSALRRSPYLKDPRVLLKDRAQRLALSVDGMIGGLQSKRERYVERTARAHDHLKLARSGLVQWRQLRFQKVSSNLDLLSPLGVFSRGYSCVFKENRTVVKDSSQVAVGESLKVRLHKGELDCQVKKIYSGS